MNEIKPINNIVVCSSSKNDLKLNQLDALLAGYFTCIKLIYSLYDCKINITHVCEDLERFIETKSVTTLDYQQLAFLHSVGLTEKQLIKLANGKHCLGNRLVDWSKDDHQVNLVDGLYGVNFNNVEFHDYMAWSLKRNNTFSYDDFSIGAQMAKTNRFTHPSKDKSSILSTFSYGLNVDTYSLVKLMQVIVTNESSRVNTIVGYVKKSNFVSKHIESLQVTSVNDEQLINTDFLIECSGNSIHFKLDKSVHSQYLSKKFIVAEVEDIENDTVINKIQQHTFGWSKIYHLKKSKIIECCYTEQSEIAVIEELLQKGIRVNQESIQEKSYNHEFISNAWQGNCLYVAQSSGNIEPIFDHYLSLLSKDIERWLSLFPSMEYNQQLVEYYNQDYVTVHKSLHDYVYAHYYFAKEEQFSFWSAIHGEPMHESLCHLTDTFAKICILPEFENNYFQPNQWFSLFFALGLVPVDQNPIIYCEMNIDKKLTDLKKYISDFTVKIPKYNQFVSYHRL